MDTQRHARPYNVVLRPAAEDDLTGIYRYIAARSSGYPERAIGYVRRIRAFATRWRASRSAASGAR